MNLFDMPERNESKDRAAGADFSAAALETLQEFLQQLALPDPFGRPGVRFSQKCGRKFSGNSHCLCFFAPGAEQSFLNAGYAAGQAAAYLRFFGADVHMQRGPRRFFPAVPCGHADLIAVLSFSMDHSCGSGTSEKEDAGLPFIFGEHRGDWSRQILAVAGMMTPVKPYAVRLDCEENLIRLQTRPSPVKRESFCEFEAGLALANIMAAGEKLWMELDMQVTERETEKGGRRCTICVRRKQDVALTGQRTARTAGRTPAPVKGSVHGRGLKYV